MYYSEIYNCNKYERGDIVEFIGKDDFCKKVLQGRVVSVIEPSEFRMIMMPWSKPKYMIESLEIWCGFDGKYTKKVCNKISQKRMCGVLEDK